jgi:hypothetical protein
MYGYRHSAIVLTFNDRCDVDDKVGGDLVTSGFSAA